MTDPGSIGEAVTRALAAYEALQSLAEDVDDEWSYVQDLTQAWRERLESVATERGGDEASPEVIAAVDRAIDEVSRITDPHRAIDWLSTFPQMVLTASGETP